MKSLSVVAPSPSGTEEYRKSLSPASSSSSLSSGYSFSENSRRSTVDGNKIRSRLLTRLGIVQQPSPGEKKAARPPATMRKVAPFSVPLKYEEEEEPVKDEDGSSPSSRSSRKKSVVVFDNQVSVVPIPKHQEYSQRIRSRLWCNKTELRNMAARNTLEYQAEGWHPSTVVEDDQFITTASGDRIHPVHLHRLLSSPFLRQPMKVMQLRPSLEVTGRSRHPMV